MTRRIALFSLVFAAMTLPLAAADLMAVIGARLFSREWVAAPSSTKANDGLGPLYSARSCAGCHGGTAARVVRLATPTGGSDPHYGQAFQDKAVPGVRPEASVSFVETVGTGPGRITPVVALNGPALARDTLMTVRLAPDLDAVGRITRVSDEAILRHADPFDRDGDGISGRVHELPGVGGNPAIGRFGWRATAKDLDHQITAAFAIDLGLSTREVPLPYGDCTATQADCRAAPNGRSGDGEEIAPVIVSAIREFLISRTPKLPKSEGAERPRLFAQTGCAACHVPQLTTQDVEAVEIYSDLLLHDMGPGLADGISEGSAEPAEWRTAPLVNLARDGRRFLHDGRAATLDQAIRWHGGEAATAMRRYGALDPALRAELLEYLRGL